MAKPNVSTTGLAATTDTSGSELNISRGFIWHVYHDRNSQIKHPNSWVETGCVLFTDSNVACFIYIKRGNLLKNCCYRITDFVTNSLSEVCIFPKHSK